MDKQQDKVSFTAGPWSIGAPRDKIIAVDENGSVRTTKNGWGKCVAKTHSAAWMNPWEEEANAHLIAASPDMYEACKVAASSRDWTELREPDYDYMSENVLEYIEAIEARVYRLEALAKAALSKANPNSNLTPSELRDKLDAVEVIGVVS